VPRPTLEPQAAGSPVPSGGGGSVGVGPALAPKGLPKQTATGAAGVLSARAQRTAPLSWAANVIGVSARIGHRAVTLVWQRPARSAHVVVLRTRGVGSRGAVVYRGSATSYRDLTARPCTAYRYTIVNYDRGGRRSTGVPTSIVTDCGSHE